MLKQIFLVVVILLMGMSTIVHAQSDNIYATVQGDTATIWHTQTQRNCASSFVMDVQVVDNLITVTEIDTAEELATCDCNFDLSVTIAPLEPGSYTVDVFSTDSLYGYYWGSTEFVIEGIDVLEQTTSDCLLTREDSSYITIDVSGDRMTLNWWDAWLNCCMEEAWDGWLNAAADTFHVAMADTGMPCNCMCLFDLSATFGHFPAGTYTLDFRNGYYGYPTFTIAALRDDWTIISEYQSDCYTAVNPQELPIATPQTFILYPNYPNPFNPKTIIGFDLIQASRVHLAIYDITGKLIKTLVNSDLQPTHYSFAWDGKSNRGKEVESGIYLYKIETDNFIETRRMTLLK